MRKKLESILKKALRQSSLDKIRDKSGQAIGAGVELSVPENANFGHYSISAALKLAKIKKVNPMDLAAELAAKIEKKAPKDFFEKIDVAAPGFINFWLSKDIIRQELASISKQKEKYGRSGIGKNKKVIIEYSSPNIAKPMHVGHLRSAVIGDALANIHEFLGYKVIRWNYVGDWGTQFGKLIAAYKRWGNKSEVQKSPIKELLSLYVRFHKEEKDNPVFAQEGRDEFMKLEGGNAQNRKLWKWFKEESMKEFKKIYATLGVKFDVIIGESFFEPYLKPLIERLYKKKIAVESEGALIVQLDEKGLPPALIQKSDESSLYLTRDIAGLEYRINKYNPAKIIYVVGNEQALHFQQLFAVAEIIGLKKAGLVHAKHGMVFGEKGKKLSTRSGEAIQLGELLQRSVNLSREVVEKKNSKLKAKEKEKIAEAVGIGAVKYNDLRENRLSDIYFDWERMLDFSGDSAPYLQYTHARLKSILRKTHKVSGVRYQVSSLDTETEMALVRKMAEFPEVVRRSSEILFTNGIAKYLYELANLANKYYESTPILTDKDITRRNARLVLIESVASVMKNGLGLLGIKAPEKI